MNGGRAIRVSSSGELIYSIYQVIQLSIIIYQEPTNPSSLTVTVPTVGREKQWRLKKND